MPRKPWLSTAWRLGATLAVSGLVLTSCSNGSTRSTTPISSTVGITQVPKPTMGGTAYFALTPGLTPNWIFPFASVNYFSTTNLTQFQYLMYRPLYWFGSPTSTSPDVDYALSPANAPSWSNDDRTVAINLKGWKFYDGQDVDAQSVIFWLNMLQAESGNWAGTESGANQWPGNVKSYYAPDGATGDTVVINLDGSYSTLWFQYNELSQISPMAEVWDVTSLMATPGSGGCGVVSKTAGLPSKAVLKACTNVWTFDTDNNGLKSSPEMAGALGTYATNKLWLEGVDGPWILKAFIGSGEKVGQSTFVPNPRYSGPQKPRLAKFVEVSYLTDQVEFEALVVGHPGAPTVGYLPWQYTPPKPAGLGPTTAGPNASHLSRSYTLHQTETWQISYFTPNLGSRLGAGGHAGAVFRQLYFRQALQELVDQSGIISRVFKGYGAPTYGPVPVYPDNNFAQGVERSAGGPYPFSVSTAISTLTAHGWNVEPEGTTYCKRAGTAAGDCGSGIPAGTPLIFTETYAETDNVATPSLKQEVGYEASTWAKAGIEVTSQDEPFAEALSVPSCLPKPTPPCRGWDMVASGGWEYDPDVLPTGEDLFATDAASNLLAGYSDAKNDALIKETNDSSNPKVFYEWEDYLARQLPVIWEPTEAEEVEISNKIHGVLPVNALENLTPEYWYYTG
jgi:peptide/nickel transport system substrate-binding protein